MFQGNAVHVVDGNPTSFFEAIGRPRLFTVSDPADAAGRAQWVEAGD